MDEARRQVAAANQALAALDGADYQQAHALHADESTAQSKLEVAESEWLEVSDAFEAVTARLKALGRG